MNGKEDEREQPTTEITTLPASSTSATDQVNKTDGKKATPPKPKKDWGKFFRNFLHFLYDPRRKTVFGRNALNWAKLSAFYTVFYICLGLFFVGLLYIFAAFMDRDVPRYYNTESTMAVRTKATVVGMGFRPQPHVDDNLILVTNDPIRQQRYITAMRLYRDVYLTQSNDDKTEECSSDDPAWEMAPDIACLFNWYHIVKNENHPCSDNNTFGYEKEEPCVLVKLNKVYGWRPHSGSMPAALQKLRNSYTNRTVQNPDVYVICEGTSPADRDVLHDMTYYSLDAPSGSSKYGVIPNYYFPYRNAPGHVQPFVLVQFKNLPFDRLISVTCKALAPHMEADPRTMRGMTQFQLYRTHQAGYSAEHSDDD